MEPRALSRYYVTYKHRFIKPSVFERDAQVFWSVSPHKKYDMNTVNVFFLEMGQSIGIGITVSVNIS